MAKSSIFAFLLAFSFTATAIPSKELKTKSVQLKGLETKIDEFVQKYQSVPNTGVAVGIVRGDQLIFFKGYGYRDRERKLPITPETLFRIGSNTKSFLSTALNRMADQGRLDLNAPVRTYLPGFNLENEDVSEKANLLDLLSHRVGLPRHDLLWYVTPLTSDELFERLHALEMNKKEGMGFREGFQYNNLMYMTLGRVAEKVSGQTWEEVITEQVLSPLEMKRTSFTVEELQNDADHARPYQDNLLLPYIQHGSVGPAGVMVSNTNDLTRWISLFLKEGTTQNGAEILSPEALDRMFQVQSHGSADGVTVDYGLGWFLEEIAGQRLIWHGGNIEGYSTHVSFMPEKNLGLIVLVNQTRGNAFEIPKTFDKPEGPVKLLPVVIYEHLIQQQDRSKPVSKDKLALLGIEGLAPKEIPFFLKTSSPIGFCKALENGQELVGEFSEPAYGTFSFYEDTNQTLRVRYYDYDWEVEIPADSNVFYNLVYVKLSLFGEPSVQLPVVVVRDDDTSEIIKVEIPLEPEVRPIVFHRN